MGSKNVFSSDFWCLSPYEQSFHFFDSRDLGQGCTTPL